ncbi:MAG: hypothetical protein ACC634_09710, partial [Hyphomicrobiales bacterium]
MRWQVRLIAAVVAVLAFLSTGFGIAAGVLYWQLASGPIALDSLQPSIQSFFSSKLGTANAEIGRVWLTNDKKKGLIVRLERVRVVDPDGRQLVSAPEAAMGISLISALTGSLNPTSVELIGPHIRVRRYVNGRVELGFASPADLAAKTDAGGFKTAQAKPATGKTGELPNETGSVQNLPDTGQSEDITLAPTGPIAASGDNLPTAETGGSTSRPVSKPGNIAPLEKTVGFALGEAGGRILSSIDNLVVSKARLSVYDEATGTNWESYGAELHISRPGGGLLVEVDAPFFTETGEWRIRIAVDQRAPGEIVGIDAAF